MNSSMCSGKPTADLKTFSYHRCKPAFGDRPFYDYANYQCVGASSLQNSDSIILKIGVLYRRQLDLFQFLKKLN